MLIVEGPSNTNEIKLRSKSARLSVDALSALSALSVASLRLPSMDGPRDVRSGQLAWCVRVRVGGLWGEKPSWSLSSVFSFSDSFSVVGLCDGAEKRSGAIIQSGDMDIEDIEVLLVSASSRLP